MDFYNIKTENWFVIIHLTANKSSEWLCKIREILLLFVLIFYNLVEKLLAVTTIKITFFDINISPSIFSDFVSQIFCSFRFDVFFFFWNLFYVREIG